jgi:hypothetical protein
MTKRIKDAMPKTTTKPSWIKGGWKKIKIPVGGDWLKKRITDQAEEPSLKKKARIESQKLNEDLPIRCKDWRMAFNKAMGYGSCSH